MISFESFLKANFEAAGAIAKIGLNLKWNHKKANLAGRDRTVLSLTQ
jgi:hypothetical protein